LHEQDLVVAFKGTDFLDDDDLEADREMFNCCYSDPKGSFDCVILDGFFSFSCNKSCREIHARDNKGSYFKLGLAYLNKIVKEYPVKNIWLTGHSLGGAVASLLSVKTQFNAVVFSSPGDSYYAKVIGLDVSREKTNQIWHYYSDCDQIAQGTCRACKLLVPVEVTCHLGNVCVCKSSQLKRPYVDAKGCLQQRELTNPYPDHNIHELRPIVLDYNHLCPCSFQLDCQEKTCTLYQ